MVGLVVLAGCGDTTTPPAPAPLPSPSSSVTVSPNRYTAAPDAVVPGYTVHIPRLGVSSSLVGVGLGPDRTLQTPPLEHPEQAAVYARGPMPGEPGPAVILGHVNGHGRPGFGARLHALTTGDEVRVDTPNGVVVFRVTRVSTVDKDEFPTRDVYSNTPGPELRLITCGGELAGHQYLGQTLVWAVEE